VERFCDRAVLLEKGEVVDSGEPFPVIQTYRQLDIAAERGEADRQRESQRWGDGAAEVVEAWFENSSGAVESVLTQGEHVTLNVRIAFRRSMESPVFGVIIKNERDDHVFVTNTMFDGIETGDYSPGDELAYRITFDVHLSDGRYSVSPAIAYQDAQRFADWREDFLGVRIHAARYTSGIVDVPHDVTIERLGTQAAQTAPAQPGESVR
jgi:hypothetical protein